MVKSKSPVMGCAAQEVEWLMATYGFSLDHAVWGHARAATMVLMPVYQERMGYTGMMSYTDMASAKARSEVMRWLQTRFVIVEESPASVGWRLGEAPAFLMAVGETERMDPEDSKK